MKKQFRIEAAYWLAFFLFLSLIEYLWDKATLPVLSPAQLVGHSLLSTLLNLPPKILFAWYTWHFFNPVTIKQRRNIFYSAAAFPIVLFIYLMLDRIINNYLVLPYVYHGIIEIAGLLEGRRVLIVLLYFGLAAGLYVSIQSVQQQLKTAAREKELVRQQLATELLFLRNQTHPHFLMNTLNNIYALARKKSDDTPEAVMRLSELLRFMLYESNGDLISLEDEIKVLEDYAGLERIRYDERLNLRFEKNIDEEGYLISPLLLLPFIENAFKHGVSEARFASFVHISLTVKDGMLELLVENSAAETEAACTKTNIGLANVKRQLELLYRDYSLDIKNNNHIYHLSLSVDLKSYAKI